MLEIILLYRLRGRVGEAARDGGRRAIVYQLLLIPFFFTVEFLIILVLVTTQDLLGGGTPISPPVAIVTAVVAAAGAAFCSRAFINQVRSLPSLSAPPGPFETTGTGRLLFFIMVPLSLFGFVVGGCLVGLSVFAYFHGQARQGPPNEPPPPLARDNNRPERDNPPQGNPPPDGSRVVATHSANMGYSAVFDVSQEFRGKVRVGERYKLYRPDEKRVVCNVVVTSVGGSSIECENTVREVMCKGDVLLDR